MVIEDAEAEPFSDGVERVSSDCPDCFEEEQCVPMSCSVGVGGQGSLAVLGVLGLLVLRRRQD
ncbi:MAG: MYXO-CTERM domain-containing protein [Cognaticolwellia sp.]